MTIHFDNTAAVYELFDADHNWLGCFDTYAEAAAARTELKEEGR
jgi:hypothetical protein